METTTYEIMVRTITVDADGNMIRETTESIPIAKIKSILAEAQKTIPKNLVETK